jgi:hypothetical protein
MKNWEILLIRALKLLESVKFLGNNWTLGGGTALMFMFDHRISKDIDIFLPDPQFLGNISPRLNDNIEINCNYLELGKLVRLQFEEGDIDFIASPCITQLQPLKKIFFSYSISIEHPVEVIAKKLFHRAETFFIRDFFDLSVVYRHYPTEVINLAINFPDKVDKISNRLDTLELSDISNILIEEYQNNIKSDRLFELTVTTCRDCIKKMQDCLANNNIKC